MSLVWFCGTTEPPLWYCSYFFILTSSSSSSCIDVSGSNVWHFCTLHQGIEIHISWIYLWDICRNDQKNTLKNSSMLYYIKKFFNYGLLSVKKKCLQKVRFLEQLIMLVIKIFFSRINAYKSTKSRAILRTLVGSGVQSWSVLFCHLFFVINKH